MATAAPPFLLASREWQAGGSVFTLLRRCDPKSARALDIAAQIAGFCNGTLTVAQTPDPAGSVDFTACVVPGYAVSLQMELGEAEPAALRQRIIELDCRLLVLEAGDWEAQREQLRELVKELA
jgi:hypothetical protein